MEGHSDKTLKALDKKTAWLKNNPRAFHFYLFRTCSLISEQLEKDILSEDDCPPPFPLEERYNAFNRTISTSQYTQPSRDIMPWSQALPAELVDTIDKQSSTIDAKNKTSSSAFSSPEKINLSTCKQGKKEKTDKLPPENIRNANGLLFKRIKDVSERNVGFSLFVHLLITFVKKPQKISNLISSIDIEWRHQYALYPAPFSWVNSKDETQCQWLWQQMQERCLGIPLKPHDNKEKYYFIFAIFDNWKGWTTEQESYLNGKNKRRNKGKFLGHGIMPENGINKNHKDILLDELKKAWEQKERRARRAKEPAAVKLTKAAQKKLEFIAHVEKTTSQEILNELINNAFNDAKSQSRQS
ncbi:TPA: hypothetical protein J7677_002268 [Escherichia coli]|nr:hypothetical protein [Escherichia coli]HAZ7203391.1 hypothetical protein [Escherichia coli]